MTPTHEAELRKLAGDESRRECARGLGIADKHSDADLVDLFKDMKGVSYRLSQYELLFMAGARAGWEARGVADAEAVKDVGCCHECDRCHTCDAFDAVRHLDQSGEVGGS